MNIDPFETVIAFLKSSADLAQLVGERIAAKHRYGSAWERGDAALTVHLDGGTPDAYTPVQDLRVEVRCYASSPQQAMRIWRALVNLGREAERLRVPVSEGAALLHAWLQASGPSTLFDTDVNMDFVLAFFDVSVGEEQIA